MSAPHAGRSKNNVGRINFAAHITDRVDLLPWDDTNNVVLCGQSPGAMAIAGTSDSAE